MSEAENQAMNCTIKWNSLSLNQWQKRFKAIKTSNLLQSYAYAQAASLTFQQKPRWGLIHIDGEEAGLVQIMEVGILGNLIHAVMLDRGPLWFDGYGTNAHFEAFCQTLNTEFPKRLGRKRRFIPEHENSRPVQKILKNSQFYPINEQKYETICINLGKSDDYLIKNTKKSWRNSLNKAKKSNISVKWDKKGEFFDYLLEKYIQDKQEKGYDGPSTALLKSLAAYFISEKNMLIGRALINDKPIAAILILCHGSGATYQIGYSSDLGRKHCAHHLLLWEALSVLRQKKIRHFDLGGINDDTAKGVKKFKEGMGGTKISLPGLYR